MKTILGLLTIAIAIGGAAFAFKYAKKQGKGIQGQILYGFGGLLGGLLLYGIVAAAFAPNSKSDDTATNLPELEIACDKTGTSLADLSKAAEDGNPDARYKLGLAYGAGGKCVAKDDAQAKAWLLDAADQYHKAAMQGDAEAQYKLGDMYFYGLGVAVDDALAETWFRKAAEQGHAGAQNNLGVTYENGEGVAKDDAEAAEWYRKAAEQGNPEAQTNLGRMYHNGHGVAQDDAQAVVWLLKAAEQGHADAWKVLVSMAGYTKDPDFEAKQYRELLEREERISKLDPESLRRELMNSPPIKSAWGPNDAMGALESMAEQGNAEAQRRLGDWNIKAKKSEERWGSNAGAVKWYLKAAEQGHLMAQLELANMLGGGDQFGFNYSDSDVKAAEQGLGREAAALHWYRKAAEQNHDYADYVHVLFGSDYPQDKLGSAYSNGWGVVKDEAQAEVWYRKAAEEYRKAAQLGEGWAQYKLGLAYFKGRGVAKDDVLAEAWLRKAQEQKIPEAGGTLYAMSHPQQEQPDTPSSDPVMRYAQNIANQLRQSPNPACEQLASMVIMTASSFSNLPDEARIDQINKALDKGVYCTVKLDY
ncbi:MAG: SEL1-like repeat protein [Gallionellaceae bacterium]|jgi:TPR repeat protein|nr:SEL1-like repeat protein [Gallionellaceae bacterium]